MTVYLSYCQFTSDSPPATTKKKTYVTLTNAGTNMASTQCGGNTLSH